MGESCVQMYVTGPPVICQQGVQFGEVQSWTNGVRLPAGAGNFSLRQRGSGAHPAFYPVRTGD